MPKSALPGRRAIQCLPRLGLALSLALGLPGISAQSPQKPAPPRRNAGGRPTHNEAERAARWQSLPVPFHQAALTPRERSMIARLAHACSLMDQLYWQQSDLGGLAMYHATRSPVLTRLFGIMGSRWDLLDDNFPFIGEEPMPPGRELFPYGLKPEDIERFVAAHPEARSAIYDPHTIVRGSPDHLTTRPPTTSPTRSGCSPWPLTCARQPHTPQIPPSPATCACAPTLSCPTTYYPSDIAWLELKNPRIDLLFAPYETHLDGMLGVKTFYGGAILLRNEAESRKLAVYQQHEADMQQALPLDSADKPSKQGHATPMEVADAPLRAGDLRYGYQAVADNLPNDARIHAEKGSKKIFFKNFMDARVNAVILPLGRRLFSAAQARQISGEGYLTATILHEMSHGLGPTYARVGGQQVDIREAVGPAFAALEEAKADVTGIFLEQWLVDHHLLPAADLEGMYASYVAGIFRTLRFGTGEPHGQAQLMEFNVLSEQGVLTLTPAGTYTIDYARLPAAMASLTHTLLLFEATGNRAATEAWFARYDVTPPSLTQALDRAKDIPVDFAPDFELTRGVRP